MESYSQIRAMTDEQVLQRVDVEAKNVQASLDWWIKELDRRDANRREKRLYWLTMANVALAAGAIIVTSVK